jgi:hypothetical protein
MNLIYRTDTFLGLFSRPTSQHIFLTIYVRVVAFFLSFSFWLSMWIQVYSMWYVRYPCVQHGKTQCFGSGFRIRMQAFWRTTPWIQIHIQDLEKNWNSFDKKSSSKEGSSSYRRSLQPPKENIQHFKT